MQDVGAQEPEDIVYGFGTWRIVTQRDPKGATIDTAALPETRVAELNSLLEQRYRYAWQLVRAVLFMRTTGQSPLDFGVRISRARLYQAAEIMAPALVIAPQIWQVASIKNGGGCPMMGG